MSAERSAISRWVCVAVHARKESACERELQRAGMETFFPAVIERRAWSDRVKEVRRALFPGYGFVHLSADARASTAVLQCRHALGIVGRRVGEPLPDVKDDVIAALRLAVDHRRAQAATAHLVRGTRVQVARGALSGAVGVVCDVKNGRSDALYVNVPLLGQTVRCELAADDVVTVLDAQLLGADGSPNRARA